MNRSTLLALFFLVLPFAALPISKAGEATFSRLGKTIYQLGKETPLKRLDLDAGVMTDITVPGLADGDGVRSLAISNAGFILCLSKTAVYAWDDVKGSDAVVVCRAPENVEFRNIAHNPANSTIALTARVEPAEAGSRSEWALFAKFEDEDEVARVRCRRVVAISDMAFGRDGTLHLSTEGDLWIGRIVREADASPYLQAFRHTPIATRETNMTTGSQMGADLMAISKDAVYSHVRRMGGSGWGHLVRVRKPPSPESEDGEFTTPFKLPDRLALYREQLAAVEILGENGTRSYLCASQDGRQVYFRASRETPTGKKSHSHWLIRDGGEPEALEVSEAE